RKRLCAIGQIDGSVDLELSKRDTDTRRNMPLTLRFRIEHSQPRKKESSSLSVYHPMSRLEARAHTKRRDAGAARQCVLEPGSRLIRIWKFQVCEDRGVTWSFSLRVDVSHIAAQLGELHTVILAR